MLKVNFDTATRLDITVRAGDDFSLTVNAADANQLPINFTGYSGKMQIKTNKGDLESILELSGVDFTFDNGFFVVSKDGLSMQIPAAKYYYDLELIDVDLKVKTWLDGVFTVNEDVTR